MLTLNRYAHLPFLRRELSKLLPVGSFAARSYRAIGDALHYRLVEWPDQEEVVFSSLFPVEALFLWIVEAGGVDVESLQKMDGKYRDDAGKLIPKSVRCELSGVEQLAAYGLWLLNSNLNVCGPSSEDDWDEDGVNPFGWTTEDVLNHHAESLLLGYQALCYAQRLSAGGALTAEEITRAQNVDFVALGRRGGEKRQAPMAQLKEWTLALYAKGSWRSARQAGHALAETVFDHGRSIGVHMSKPNAARTIAHWIRNSDVEPAPE